MKSRAFGQNNIFKRRKFVGRILALPSRAYKNFDLLAWSECIFDPMVFYHFLMFVYLTNQIQAKRDFKSIQDIIQEKEKKKHKIIPVHKANSVLNDGALYNVQQNIFSAKTKQNILVFEKYLQDHHEIFRERLFLNHKKFDTKRRQMDFVAIVRNIKNEEERKMIEEILNQISLEIENYIITQVNSEYILSIGNVIMSSESTDYQAWHTDFDEKKKYKYVPTVFFLAISACRLEFYNDNGKDITICIKSGDVLNFNGYAIHRGCRYKNMNFRVHWYALHKDDANDIKKVGQDTHIYTNLS